MHWKWTCALGAILLGSAGILPARQSTDSARNTRSVLSALNRLESFSPTDDFAPASAADPDLGEQLILTRVERYRPFNVSAGYSALWTSNAFYSPSSPSSDVLMSAFGEAVALPHLGNNFFFEGIANLTGYRYLRNPVLDFNSLQASAGLLKVFREFHDVGLYTRYEYLYLFGRNGGNLLQEHSIAAGLRKTFQFNRAHALFLAAEAEFSLGGQPSYALTHDFSLYAAHHIDWSRWFNTSLFYRMDILPFTRNGGRTDLTNSLGMAFNVLPLRWLTISGTTWLGWNASNRSAHDYFIANLGGGITASINF